MVSRMRAMVLEKQGEELKLLDLPRPEPKEGQALIRVHVCGICRTDLHVLDGDLPDPKLPLIMGHQIVGEIVHPVDAFKAGDRVGVPWLGKSCGHCEFCAIDRENLCDNAEYTGYTLNGGFAEYCVADPAFCFKIPENYPDLQAAPLLCAGLIGYRAYRMCGEGERVGFYGFGASAHILIQLARYEGREIYAFTREGDSKGQAFAEKLGAVWTGPSTSPPPKKLDSAIIFAPVGPLVPAALKGVKKGGSVVLAGIHMSDIPSFPYALLWEERILRSVANLTRRDGEEFLKLAPKAGIRTETTPYPLEKTNEALEDLRRGRFNGAAVITL